MKQKGQVIIVLLLIILVSLTIGLAVVQNSLTDISTSTKTDQASRAYAAAEAGLESALLTDSESDVTVGTSKAKININSDLPGPGQALEYPPISKADFAQFWFQDPNGSSGNDYITPIFHVYFGNCDTTPCDFTGDTPPAIEINTVINSSTGYRLIRNYYDSQVSRTPQNSFVKADSCNGDTQKTSSSPASKFYCKTKVNLELIAGEKPILARVRLLYSNKFQKIALGPDPENGLTKFPPQASTYKSTGIAGNSSRELKVFREKKVVPYFFDYAIFSNTNVEK